MLNRRRNFRVLLYFIGARHGKHSNEYGFGRDEFYIRLFYFQKKSASQSVLREQRRSVDYIMGVRLRERPVADSGYRLFLRIFVKRRLRLYKLDKDRKETKSRRYRPATCRRINSESKRADAFYKTRQPVFL